MNPLRAYAVAACAIAILLVAAGAWWAHVASIGTLLDNDAANLQSIAQSASAAHPERLLRSAMLPCVHVRFVDADAGIVYDAQDGTIEQHPLPGGLPPPQPGGAPGQPHSVVAADIAHIPPRHVATPIGDLTLLPAAEDLTRWLLYDLAIASVALIVLGAFVSQSNRAEAKRARADTDLRVAREAEYRRFVADAGHELKTPLTIVTGYVDVLDEHLRDGDVTERRIVGGLRSETKRMRELVEKLLMLSRLDARASMPEFVDVATIVQTTTDDFQRRYRTRAFEIACGSDANVIIDRHDLEAALSNLIENALRYAPESRIRIEASRHIDRVIINVIDQGPGVDQDEQAKIFDRFYRGKERTDAEGSGLGLAIVRAVAERWDGSAHLTSGNGETRFTLNLPLAEEADA